MLKSFLGIDLKTGGQVILAICLIENLIIYSVLTIARSRESGHHEEEFMQVPVVNMKIDVHVAFQHSLVVFSAFAIVLSVGGLLWKRNRLIMWLYLLHQGIGIEVLFMLAPAIALRSASVLSVLPIFIFALVKCYCWCTMVSLYRFERAEERRIQFGKQWIINTLMTMEPGIRLTIPGDALPQYRRLE